MDKEEHISISVLETEKEPINKKTENSTETENAESDELLYGIKDTPPWYLCIAFGLQHYLLAFGIIVGVPLIVSDKLCLNNDTNGNLVRANLICSIFFVSGVCTVLQTTIGSRLPIMQGSSFAYLAPTIVILLLPHNQCPSGPIPSTLNSTELLYNDTDGEIVNEEELWQKRMQEIQGSIAVASVLEVILGFSGIIGRLMPYIGPLTVMPTITLIGLDLFAVAADKADGQWGIALLGAATMILASQYLSNKKVPLPAFTREKKCHIVRLEIFKMFPLFIALGVSWFVCIILTVTNAIPNDPKHPFYEARTDTHSEIFQSSPWFRVPYPGQWGLPRVTLAGVFGMFAAVIASTVESIGDYSACASLCKAPPPPSHALNRGIMMEGIGCIFAGLVGTTSGTTSFSANIAAIGITKVASRRVLQSAGLIFIVLGTFGKFGAIFVTMPNPVLAGMFFVMFSMIASIGLSNLKYVDLQSSRNIFIIGFTLFMGLSVANWTKSHRGAIQTGVSELDQVITVLLSSSMLIGGLLGAFLDNTLPGTLKERGIVVDKTASKNDDNVITAEEAYGIPFLTNCCSYAKSFPISSAYQSSDERCRDA